MNVKIEILPNVRIAYMRRTGQYGPANLEVMERLKKWAKERKLLESAVIFAISQDRPDITLPELCRFDACIIIPNDYQIDNHVNEGELLSGKYLIYDVKHTAEAIQKAYIDIFSSLDNSGFKLDNRPIMERYTGDIIDNPSCEICIPISS
ncbi:GyrI-like domain-containing protein [Cytobacillus spongiae]|jgi:DNA gyrase inhibitor GyrI|uniref:AraC family transcriptional regulator n=1 Tax=Cytobacillus spongiae TaxID=2901381 RepID=UPI001F31B70C|nr:GyrI-like domain-containing protein [Cytobacillus spongiae]UII54295.1 GyrI-like domain-containing protein [Cytobacillus spongiae]